MYKDIIVPDWPIAQKKYEILALQELLKGERIARILEIGTWTGGSALLWAKMVSRYVDGIVYCCDLSFKYGVHYAIEPGVNIVREYPDQLYRNTKYNNYIVEFEGNSHDANFIANVTNKILNVDYVDLLFIDGDHSYEGVQLDYLNYSPLVRPGGYIAFHDIVDSEYHRQYGVYVNPFWRELITHGHVRDWWEFIDMNEYPGLSGGITPSKSMGIGVIRKS